MTASSPCTSSGVPSTSFSPWTRTATRSQRLKMNRMSCSMTRTASPLSRMAKTGSSASGSPAGSCRRWARRAGAGRGRWPARGRSPACAVRRRGGCGRGGRPCARPTNSRSSMARSRVAASSRLNRAAQDRRSRGPSLVRVWRPTRTFSSTVMLAKSRMFWKVRATPAAVTLVRLRRQRRAAVADLARGRDVEAGEAVEERGLAGAVGADQADDLAVVDGEVDVADGGETAEAHGDAAGLEDRLGRARRGVGRSSVMVISPPRSGAPASLTSSASSVVLLVELELPAPVGDEALGRKRIMRTSATPKTSSRYSSRNRSFSGIRQSSAAPRSGPVTVPMPPRTTAASRKADSRNDELVGADRGVLRGP